MKKVLSLVLVLVMCLSMSLMFSSCDSTNDGPNSSGSGNNSSSFKVGAIYINSRSDTSGYTYAHHTGIVTAMESLGLSAETDLFVLDNIDEDTAMVTSAIDALANKGCNLIIGISYGYMDAFDAAAAKPQYQDIIFSHATGWKSNETNLNNYFGRIYQARYLAGIAAGLKSLELGNNNLGYVAAYGLEYAETCSGINAFALGARSVNPNAKVYVKKLNKWGDEALERQTAEALIDTYDCCVVAQHCDSAQPQRVAEAKKVFGCGYNSDMSVEAPSAHLTAPIWNWNVYYKLAIQTAKEEPSKFMEKVGIYYGGLKEGFVDISPLSKNCTPDTAEIVGLVKNLIISGEWDVFSGVKLSFEKGADGKYAIVKTDADLLQADGTTVIVEAGGASVDDGVIKGSMNYYVNGVIEG